MLRDFHDDDAIATRDLIVRTIEASYATAYPPRAIEFFKSIHSVEAILDRARRGLVLVVEESGSILGTGALVDGDVSAVFVDPLRQREGLGDRIMDSLEEHARDVGESALSLSVSLPSRGFYERRGYVLGEARSIDVGAGERLDYWQATKQVG